MTGNELAVVAGVAAEARGVGRLAHAVVDNRGRTARARNRGVAMVSLVDSVAAAELEAEIRVVEADGASWSMTLTSARPSAAEARTR